MKDRTAADAIVAAEQFMTLGRQPWPLRERSIYRLYKELYAHPSRVPAAGSVCIAVVQVSWWGVVGCLFTDSSDDWHRTQVWLEHSATFTSIQWTDIGCAELISWSTLPTEIWAGLEARLATTGGG